MGSSSRTEQLNTGLVGVALGSSSDSSGVVGESFSDYLEWLDDEDRWLARAGEPPTAEPQDCVLRGECQRVYANADRETGYCDVCGPKWCDKYSPPTDHMLCEQCHTEPAANGDGLCRVCHYGGIPEEEKLMCLNCNEQFGTLLPNWFDICIASDRAVPCLCQVCKDTTMVRTMAETRCMDSGCYYSRTNTCPTTLGLGADPYKCLRYYRGMRHSGVQHDRGGTWYQDEDNDKMWIFCDTIVGTKAAYRAVSQHQSRTEVPTGCGVRYMPDGTTMVPVIPRLPLYGQDAQFSHYQIMAEVFHVPGYAQVFRNHEVSLAYNAGLDRYLYATRSGDQVSLCSGMGKGTTSVERAQSIDMDIRGNDDALMFLSMNGAA